MERPCSSHLNFNLASSGSHLVVNIRLLASLSINERPLKIVSQIINKCPLIL
jgi:hypothetical protein